MPRKLPAYLLFTILITMSACSDSTPTFPATPSAHLTIAVSTTPLSTPLYVAKARQLYAKNGVEVTIKDRMGGYRCLSDVLQGNAQLGTTSDYPVMDNAFSRDDFVVVATFVTSNNDVKLVTRKSSGIHSAEKLRGKRIGVVELGSSHFFLYQFLLFNGMKMTDVHPIAMHAEDMPEALLKDRVDAVSIWEPFGFRLATAIGDDAMILPNENYYRETFNLVVKKDYLQENRDAVKAVIKALVEAMSIIYDEKELAQDIVQQKLGLDRRELEWTWSNYNFALTMDQSLLITLENEADWAVESGLKQAGKSPNFLNFLDPGPLGEIDPAAVTLIQ